MVNAITILKKTDIKFQTFWEHQQLEKHVVYTALWNPNPDLLSWTLTYWLLLSHGMFTLKFGFSTPFQFVAEAHMGPEDRQARPVLRPIKTAEQ